MHLGNKTPTPTWRQLFGPPCNVMQSEWTELCSLIWVLRITACAAQPNINLLINDCRWLQSHTVSRPARFMLDCLLSGPSGTAPLQFSLMSAIMALSQFLRSRCYKATLNSWKVLQGQTTARRNSGGFKPSFGIWSQFSRISFAMQCIACFKLRKFKILYFGRSWGFHHRVLSFI